jgi:hypothetical protein
MTHRPEPRSAGSKQRKETMKRIQSMARLGLASFVLAAIALSGATAQAVSLPTKKPIALVNYNKTNEPYYLDTYKADIDRLESGLNAISAQKIGLTSKNKLNIFLDSVDMILFRQFCDKEGIRVSDADIQTQIAQYKASLGAGVTDAMVDASLRRNGVFTDLKTYVRQDMLFTTYLRQRKADDVKAISQLGADDVMKAYEDMKFDLRRPATCRFTMLVVRTQGKSDAEKKKSADMMKGLAKQLQNDPSKFDGLLAKGALEPNDSGFQTMANLVFSKTADNKKQYPALYDALFKMKEGEVSDLLEDAGAYEIARVSAFLPEKQQLLLDDSIEGLNTPQATRLSAMGGQATVIAYIANEIQQTRYTDLQKKTKDEINAKLRKEGTITITLANFAGLLDDAEIATLKSLKSDGTYNFIFQ